MDIIKSFDYYSYSKLIIASLTIGFSYYPLKKYLNKYKNYDKLSDDKKMYVTKNIIKSGILAMLSFRFTPQLIQLIHFKEVNQNLFRLYGALYVGNDLAGLLFVNNLPNSTKLHHSSTVLLYTILCAFNINKYPICRMMSIYTIFSCYPFLVNLYLGLRYLKEKNTQIVKYNYNINTFIDIIRRTSYYTYLVSCSLNWTTHAYILGYLLYNKQFSYLDLLYSGILYPIITDDLILMNWLKNNK